MFNVNCIGKITWNGKLVEYSEGCFSITFLIRSDRQDRNKYKRYLKGEEASSDDSTQKEDVLYCTAFGIVAKYIDKCLKTHKQPYLELTGLLQQSGEKVRANSSSIDYFEKDINKPKDAKDAYEQVDSGFADNVYVRLNSYKLLVNDAALLDCSPTNTKGSRKVASKANKNKDEKEPIKEPEKEPEFVKVDSDDDWDD